jgi:hypothetical protein
MAEDPFKQTHRFRVSGYYIAMKGGKGSATADALSTIYFAYNREGKIISSERKLPKGVHESVSRRLRVSKD